MVEHFTNAFPTLFVPIQLPSSPIEEKDHFTGISGESKSILKCFNSFLLDAAVPQMNMSCMHVVSEFMKLHQASWHEDVIRERD
jgi:hypothetical protein